jgi:hypothetical protein
MVAFKVVNSTVRPSSRAVFSTPLKVGEWFGSLDLTMAPVDAHTIFLGQEFLKISKVVPMPHGNCLIFLNGTKTCGVPMMNRRKLGWMQKTTNIRLIEATSESTIRPCVTARQQE